jgi:RNA polymerase sigma factor (sigma-70 family)
MNTFASDNQIDFGLEIPDSDPKKFTKELESKMVDNLGKLMKRAFDPQTKQLYKDADRAKDVAAYENALHELALKYSFVAKKVASEYCKQCQFGMSFGDLVAESFMGIIAAIEKWPPFHGEKDKGYRMLSLVQRAAKNAVFRFIDKYNRRIRIPSYKIEKLTVRINADDVLNGKKVKGGKRKDVTAHDRAIKEHIESIGLSVNDVDNKSLRDIALETGNYQVVADILKCDVAEIVSIITPSTSLDLAINDDQDTMADLIPADDNGNDCSRRRALEDALEYIPNKHKTVLVDHYFNQMSIQDIANKNGYTKTRATQMLKKAVSHIRSSETAMNILNHMVVGKAHQ